MFFCKISFFGNNSDSIISNVTKSHSNPSCNATIITVKFHCDNGKTVGEIGREKFRRKRIIIIIIIIIRQSSELKE